jgi:hypothetical protein
VRRALLAAQGLSEPRPGERGPDDVLAAIRRMHALQIDTISVVARSPYFVLWSRLGHYEPAILDGLLANGALFEHWSHAACFLDVEDYGLYRRMMLDSQTPHRQRQDHWLEANRELVDGILARIREQGPVRSADFERPEGQRGNGWWDWKTEKIALELLFTRGDLMVTARHNFQRLYDLRERVLPEWDDALAPPAEEARRALALKVARTLGVARPEWIAWNLHTLWWGKPATRKLVEQLAADGDLIAVEVEGWKTPGYVHPENVGLLDEVAEGGHTEFGTKLLSPFDPVTWDRARALELFDFDYRIECYTPAPKRRYGYFTLPILHGDALVGRLDPKAHRKDGMFEVKSVHLEPGVEVTNDLVAGLAGVLRETAAWHRTPELVVRETNPTGLKKLLQARL